MTPIDIFDRLVNLHESLIEVRADIKQICTDAEEHGITKRDIKNIKALASARAAGNDETKLESARSLLSTAEQLDLFGMREAA